MVPTAEEYEDKAAECEALAQRAKEAWSKTLLLHMAESWIKQAMKAKGELRASESEH